MYQSVFEQVFSEDQQLKKTHFNHFPVFTEMIYVHFSRRICRLSTLVQCWQTSRWACEHLGEGFKTCNQRYKLGGLKHLFKHIHPFWDDDKQNPPAPKVLGRVVTKTDERRADRSMAIALATGGAVFSNNYCSRTRVFEVFLRSKKSVEN